MSEIVSLFLRNPDICEIWLIWGIQYRYLERFCFALGGAEIVILLLIFHEAENVC